MNSREAEVGNLFGLESVLLGGDAGLRGWSGRALALVAGVALALSIGAVMAAPASAASYSNGRYSGRVRQAHPNYLGRIEFVVKGNVVTMVKTTVKFVCAHGNPDRVTTWRTGRRWKVKISRGGRFSFNGHVQGGGNAGFFGFQLTLRGTIGGKTASGKIDVDDEAGCLMSSPSRFTARR